MMPGGDGNGQGLWTRSVRALEPGDVSRGPERMRMREDDFSPTSMRLSLDVPTRSFNYHLHFSAARHG
jgi:hypothetical protein